MNAVEVAPAVWGFYPSQHDGAGGDFGTTDCFINARVIGIGWPSTGNLDAFIDQGDTITALTQRLLETYQHEPHIARLERQARDAWGRRSAGTINRFLCEAKPGDIVVYACKNDQHVHVGRICDTADGRYLYDGATAPAKRLHWHFHHFRAVDWIKQVPYALCANEELRQVQTQNTFWRIKSCPERFLADL